MTGFDVSTSKNNLSPQGLALIKNREGLRPFVYRDSVGRPTIGYGHLLTGEFAPDLCWSADQSTKQLELDIQVATGAINNLVKVPLSQPQFDALVSLVFNIGVGHFQDSTLLSLLNGSNYEKAGMQILVWCKQQELLMRRMMEYAIWIYGTI